MQYHLDSVQDIAGFATENVKGPGTVKVLMRALLTSDDPDFYRYIEHFSNAFLNKSRILIDGVHQFLLIVHDDLSADLYVNDFPVAVEINAKRAIASGEYVTHNDIADIRRIKFLDVEFKETDRVVYCFKVGWRFGLFFDLTSRRGLPGTEKVAEKLDVEAMMLDIGGLRRYLSFYHVYKALESEAHFSEMMKDGWFPFIEMLGRDYKSLSEVYKSKFDFENKVKAIIDSFTEERIKRVTDIWWKNQIYSDKKTLIQAGINAYLQNDQDGCVNCIKNLWTEIEGVLRKLYHEETGKGDGVKSKHLIAHIIQKAKTKSGSDYSLFLPLPFLEYLQDVVFANFNVTVGKLDMSRNSSSHGVADAQLYTKERALQLILILDQIYFYSS